MPRTSSFDKLRRTFDIESPFKRNSNHFILYFIIFIILIIIGYVISLYINNDKKNNI